MAKRDTKVNTLPEPKAEPKSEPKAEPKAEPKPAPKVEPKPTPKPAEPDTATDSEPDAEADFEFNFAAAVGTLEGPMAEVGVLLLASLRTAQATLDALASELAALEELQRRRAGAQDAAAKARAGLSAILGITTPKPAAKRGRPAGTGNGSRTPGADKVAKWLEFFQRAPAIFDRDDIFALEVARNPSLSEASAKQAVSGTIHRACEAGIVERVERGQYRICPEHAAS